MQVYGKILPEILIYANVFYPPVCRTTGIWPVYIQYNFKDRLQYFFEVRNFSINGENMKKTWNLW